VKREPKAWSPEILTQIERVKTLGPAAAPFSLRQEAFVSDPVKFHEALLSEAALGSDGPRARLGALQADLKGYLEHRERA
jgi:hypothetical protein